MNEQIQKIIENLDKNNMKGYYAKNIEEVQSIVKEMLFDGCTITSGGSMSLKESGVFDIISSSRYNFLDRAKKGISEEEKLKAFKTAIGCDFFFCSSNAITESGELVNVDGFANRVSSIAFGPKNVIMIVGKNKIVETVYDGFLRVKKISAPMNTIRLNLDTPCKKLGHCISLEKTDHPLMTDGCACNDRICDSFLVCARQRIKNRIKVIICDENLGY